VYVLIVCTVTLPPGVNRIAVDKYIYLSNRNQQCSSMLSKNDLAIGYI